MVYLQLNLSPEKLHSSLTACVETLNEREAELQRREERVHQRELALLNEREAPLLRREDRVRRRETELMAIDMEVAGGRQLEGGTTMARVKKVRFEIPPAKRDPARAINVDPTPPAPRAPSPLLGRTQSEPAVKNNSRQGKVAKPKSKAVKGQGKKRAITAYNLFRKARLIELGAQGVKQGPAFKLVGTEWKAMPAEEKAKWEAQAVEANARRDSSQPSIEMEA